MAPFPILARLPPGFRVLRGDGGVLALREDLASALLDAGFGPEGGERLVPSKLHGRSPLYELTAAGRRLVVRRFTHGGLLRFLTGSRFADPERPFREIVLAEALGARGVPTATCVAARARRRGPFWRLDLVSERIEGVLDGGEILERLRSGRPSEALRRALLATTGRLVGAMHAAGFLHADLQPKNLLVEDSFGGPEDREAAARRPRTWLLDLDRSELRESLTDAERGANLARLARSVAWAAAERGPALRRSELLRFLDAYERARGGGREERRRDAREVLRRLRAGRLRHRLGRWLERLVGPVAAAGD